MRHHHAPFTLLAIGRRCARHFENALPAAAECRAAAVVTRYRLASVAFRLSERIIVTVISLVVAAVTTAALR